ncbi:MAG: nitric oxide reductase [Rhodocyclaceae bacterium]|nr:nitric oxide reductase [Rhodocyclaceae bacterium]
MEEFVGELWHRFITRVADKSHPEAAVSLAEVEKTAGILFRALGGDPGLRVAQAANTEHGGRRRLLQRLAGSGEKVTHASVDGETLSLPPRIAFFPDRPLNRDLYLWLIALASRVSGDSRTTFPSPLAGEGLGARGNDPEAAWLIANQEATRATLARFPGLESRYRRLVDACLALRLPPERLPPDEAVREITLRAALTDPGSVRALPPAPKKAKALQPVPLWLYPSADSLPTAPDQESADDIARSQGGREEEGAKKRHKAKKADMPQDKNGIVLHFRAESLFSWGEYVKVNRHTDEDENPDAARAAEDMEFLAVARDGRDTASKVRFDLDLPSASEDDTPLGEGILLPEWDWKKRLMRPDHCRVQLFTARNAPPIPIPPRLARTAKRLRSQFASLTPARRWLKDQPEGVEPDVDACVRDAADRLAGIQGDAMGHYLSQVRKERDMACLVLADLSLSTDAYVSNHQRVIDVIRDSLMLFSEALSATGDRFGLYGFSSLKRDHVRFQRIKEFDSPFNAEARGRIAALKPGYYTRMGAAIRQATSVLEKQPAALRLLLILSDGKPNDLDSYEGRYGIEDTRMALIEARDKGLRPFCVTIDKEGAAYLPHLFGPAGYTIIRKPEELPARLPMLYARLTAN